MIGLDGIGVFLALSLFFIIFVPIITLILLSHLNLFDSFKKIIKIIISGIVFLLISILVLIIIRNFQFSCFKYLLIYSIALSLIVLLLNIKSRK